MKLDENTQFGMRNSLGYRLLLGNDLMCYSQKGVLVPSTPFLFDCLMLNGDINCLMGYFCGRGPLKPFLHVKSC